MPLNKGNGPGNGVVPQIDRPVQIQDNAFFTRFQHAVCRTPGPPPKIAIVIEWPRLLSDRFSRAPVPKMPQ